MTRSAAGGLAARLALAGMFVLIFGVLPLGLTPAASAIPPADQRQQLKIKFQPAGEPAPAGYLVDTGQPLGARGDGLRYGWNEDVSRHAFARDYPDPLRRSGIYIRPTDGSGPFAWRVEGLPRGSYSVRVLLGDPDVDDGYYILHVNGIKLVGGPTSPRSRWLENTQPVQVTDGSIQALSTASQNTPVGRSDSAPLNLIEIRRLADPTPEPSPPAAPTATPGQGQPPDPPGPPPGPPSPVTPIVRSPGDPRLLRITDGDDWSVSEQARVAPNSGIYWVQDNRVIGRLLDEAHDADGTFHAVKAILIKWKDLEPAEGQFDWSAVDGLIDSIDALPPSVGFMIWPRYSTIDEIPAWAAKKWNIYPARGCWSDERQDYTCKSDILAFWKPDSRMNDGLDHLVAAIARHVARNPRFAWVEMRVPVPHSGEYSWYNLDDEWADSSLGRHGQDTEAFYARLRAWNARFHDIWFGAFRGSEQKLVAVYSSKGWGAPLAEEFLLDAYRRGAGQRDGGPSGAYYWPRGTGNSVGADGYVTFNRAFNGRSNAFYNGAVSASEVTEFSEQYIPDREWQYPAFRYFMLYQLTNFGRNWVSHNDWSLGQNDLIRWEQYQLGQTLGSSSEAWVALNETRWPEDVQTTYGVEAYPTLRTKNFSRGLYQRDIGPDGVTAADWPLDLSQRLGERRASDWLARRTDRASGNTAMYFTVDPAFLSGGPYRALLYVTYRDGAGVAWRVEYSDGRRLRSSAAITGAGATGWRTAVIELPGIVAGEGPLAGDSDLRIVSTGRANLSVDLVRLVKP